MERLRWLAKRYGVSIRVVPAPPRASLLDQGDGRWLLTVSDALAPEDQMSAAATLMHTLAVGPAAPYHVLTFADPAAPYALRQAVARERRLLREAHWTSLAAAIPDTTLRRWEAEATPLAEAAAEVGLPEADVLERYRLARMVRAEALYGGRKPSLAAFIARGQAILRAAKQPHAEVMPLRRPPAPPPPPEPPPAPEPPPPEAPRLHPQWARPPRSRAERLAAIERQRQQAAAPKPTPEPALPKAEPIGPKPWPFMPAGGFPPAPARCPVVVLWEERVGRMRDQARTWNRLGYRG